MLKTMPLFHIYKEPVVVTIELRTQQGSGGRLSFLPAQMYMC
jgi:hypothetical protein